MPKMFSVRNEATAFVKLLASILSYSENNKATGRFCGCLSCENFEKHSDHNAESGQETNEILE